MRKGSSYREKHNFLHLAPSQIQNRQKLERPPPLPTFQFETEDIESQQIANTQLPETQLPGTKKVSNLPERGKHISKENSLNDQLLHLLTQDAGMRQFFNIEELSAEEQSQLTLGTYESLVKQAESQGITKESLDRGLDIEAAQHYALLQIYLKTEDAHGQNIVVRIDPNHHLIPSSLDCSHCLCEDPTNAANLPRTTEWEKWPALDLPTSPSIENFVMKNDPEDFVERIKENYLSQSGWDFSAEQKDLLEKRIYHLKCNMIMVKEAISAGLRIKQILALFLPVVDDFALKFVTQGILKGGELWPARKRYASLHTSFRTAWNKARKEPDEKRAEIFTQTIRQEIQSIKELTTDALEKNYFQGICYELRKGLYL